MAEQTLRLYEAMFLVEPNVVSDWEATKGMIQTLMDRGKVELLTCRLWDERRLAYDIEGHKRAAYVLCHFRANGTTISSMERDVQLSEHILRVLILRADHIAPEQLEELQARPERREPAAESRTAEYRPGFRDKPQRTPAESPPVKEAQTERASDEQTPPEAPDIEDQSEPGSDEQAPAETSAAELDTSADEPSEAESPLAEPEKDSPELPS